MQFLCFPYGTNIQCWCDNTGTIKRCVPVLLNLGIFQYQEDEAKNEVDSDKLSELWRGGERTELFLAVLFLVLVVLIFILFVTYKCNKICKNRKKEMVNRQRYKAIESQTELYDVALHQQDVLQQQLTQDVHNTGVQHHVHDVHDLNSVKQYSVRNMQGVQLLYPPLLQDSGGIEGFRLTPEDTESRLEKGTITPSITDSKDDNFLRSTNLDTLYSTLDRGTVYSIDS